MEIMNIGIVLQECFGDELVVDIDFAEMVGSLLTHLTHPALPVGHRLLMYEWLMHMPDGQVSTAHQIKYNYHKVANG